MGLSGLFSLPVLSALPSSPPNQESEEACGEAGPRQDLTLLLPPASTEGGGYQPGITKNTVTMTTSHQPQDRYWGTWAVNPGEWKGVSRRLDAICLGIWGCHHWRAFRL